MCQAMKTEDEAEDEVDDFKASFYPNTNQTS